jgi:hypothetical protein
MANHSVVLRCLLDQKGLNAAVSGESSSEFTKENLQSMAEERVKGVMHTLNAFPSILTKVAISDALHALWAEWIFLGVPGDLLDEFVYEFQFVEYVDNSTFGASTAEWRDIAIETTMVMSMDPWFYNKPTFDDLDDDVVRLVKARRAVFSTRPACVPRGNGRYVWLLEDGGSPKWEGAVCALPEPPAAAS